MTDRRRKAFDQAWLAVRVVLAMCFVQSANADSLHGPLQIWFVRHAESELNEDS
jgi:hypothetical protein